MKQTLFYKQLVLSDNVIQHFDTINKSSMPCLKILTNISHKDIPRDFVTKIVPLLSKVLRKPETRFICAVSGDCHISFLGDNSLPGAVATIESVGNLAPEDNKVIIREVSKYVEKELNIQPDRFFLTFYDMQPSNVGTAGNTVG